MEINQDRGLTAIPDHVRDALGKDTLALLATDGHGISFPEPTGCQLRVVREGIPHGGFFAYNQYGGPEYAIEAAIEECQRLRKKYRITGNLTRDHVQWVESYRRSRGGYEYSYRVYIKVNGKVRAKSFGFGSKLPSADKQLHAYRTARLFYHFYEQYGDDINLYWSWFDRWKEVRLYYPEQPWFDWKNT
ncbi:hypothetical protein [Marinobacterium sp. BA1]|uniref:hypothetical protein n=1 Tax=Marinobacterium sp. BA1 TaxID=3138931 RepID=UPI0032E754D5